MEGQATGPDRIVDGNRERKDRKEKEERPIRKDNETETSTGERQGQKHNTKIDYVHQRTNTHTMKERNSERVKQRHGAQRGGRAKRKTHNHTRKHTEVLHKA